LLAERRHCIDRHGSTAAVAAVGDTHDRSLSGAESCIALSTGVALLHRSTICRARSSGISAAYQPSDLGPPFVRIVGFEEADQVVLGRWTVDADLMPDHLGAKVAVGELAASEPR
jgi:hypothetical protein